MSDPVGVHRQLGVLLEAQVASLRLASVNKRRREDKRVALIRMRVAFARMVATTPHPPWVTEAVKARRPRNLMEDNPASG